MPHSYRTGHFVAWKWGNGTACGKVIERFERVVERTIKGSRIKRKGSGENPAYLIKQDDGDRVLKLGSELNSA